MPQDSTIRQLTREDLPFAQAVREIAGWNQTDRDWLRLIEHNPDGCFLIEHEGQPAGTATTTRYGTDLAWIGMALIHPEFRRKGLASRLLEQCVNFLLEEKGVRCIKLDATPDGQKVYERLGFQVEYELARWEYRSTPKNAPHRNRKREIGGFSSFDLDKIAFGADRNDFLARLAKDSDSLHSDNESFGMIRSGSNASYLGPVISDDPDIGKRLITGLLSETDDFRVFWDIIGDHTNAIQLAKSLGFSKQRDLIRMWVGESNPRGIPCYQWAIGGPETG